MKSLLIIAAAFSLMGCASDYQTGPSTRVSEIQPYALPDSGVIYFNRGTADEVMEICNAASGSTMAMACIIPKGGNVWVIHAPNKKTAMHEFKHFVYGSKHITSPRNAKWMREQEAKAQWRLEIAKGDNK